MENLYGIVHTEDGRYVMATIRSNDAGTWSLAKVRQWQSHNVLRGILLFHRGIYFGIASWWKPHQDNVPITNMLIASDKSSVSTDTDGSFDVITHAADIDIHRETLQANLLAMVPEDTFLATLPLYLSDEAGDSFVSIYGSIDHYSIGVTIDRKLTVSFRMTPGSPERLSGHIGRIKRYWNMNFPDKSFPDTIVTIGDMTNTPDSAFEKSPIRVLDTEKDIYVLKAMGSAFAQKESTVSRFAEQTPEASFRKKRTWIYGVSGGLVCLGLCAVALFSGIDFWFVKKKAAYEEEYQHIVVYNQEVKKLTERNNELAETILRLEDTFTRRTLWGKFLHEIGKNKPGDLYFERFGSEPIPNNSQAIRIALSGWTPEEKSVTNFIAKLQNMPYVTQITPSSIERDKKKRSIYGFKILCTLLLNEQ